MGRPSIDQVEHGPAVPVRGRTAGTRWFWRQSETARVVAFGVLLLAVSALVTTVSLRRIANLEADVRAVAEEAQPALDALHEVQRGQMDNVQRFDAALLARDSVARALLFDESRRSLSATETAWREYQRTSLGLPGEAELQERYEALRTDGDLLSGLVGLALVDGRPLDDVLSSPVWSDLQENREALHAIVEELRAETYVEVRDQRVAALQADIGAGRREVRAVIAIGALSGLAFFAMTLRSSRRHVAATAQAERDRTARARRDALEARVHRALDMSRSEHGAHDVLERTLVQLLDDTPFEVLVADSDDGHFQQVLDDVPGRTRPGCPVVSPEECPAATGADTRRFADSEAIDACPHLRGRAGGACSAVCIPMRLAGTGIGVVHLTQAPGHLPAAEVVDDVELVTNQAGERLGLLRLLAETTLQARHDPLTGLLNRRSLESAVARLVADGTTYVVAYGDLDRFKALNDSFGHDAGDRALRLFSRVLRDNVRPLDLVCRYGGEEFVVVLPGCATSEAAEVIERVRRSLAKALDGSTTPDFTVSFGLAGDGDGASFEEVVGAADRALMAAKAAGRDRVLLAGQPVPDPRRA